MRFVLILVILSMAGAASAQPRRGGPRHSGPPPLHMLERLNRMSPQQRERMLSKLPPDRKATVEERLDRYNNLPPEQKKRLRDEYDQFEQLPAEKQESVRKMFREFSQFPDERRPEIRRELNHLRRLSAEDRQARFSSEEYRQKFSPAEQKVLENLSDVLGQP